MECGTRLGCRKPTKEANTVAKPELGEKHLCASCETKYYDLNRDPIVCPKCGTVFVVEEVAKPVVVKPKAAPEAPAEEKKKDSEDSAETPETISLEDADDDDEDDTVDGDNVPDDIPDVEVEDDEEGEDDSKFLDDDDEDDDVSDLVPVSDEKKDDQ